MVAVCVRLIVDGKLAFNDVPKSLQEKVRQALSEAGMNLEGKPAA